MDNQTESGKGPADLAIAEVGRIVRGLPDDLTLEQLQGIVATVADAFGVDPEEIDGSMREGAGEAAHEAASESAEEAAREETDDVYLDHMHGHSTEAIEAALEPVREKARERQNEAFEEAYNKHYDEEAYRDAYRAAGLLEYEDDGKKCAEAQAARRLVLDAGASVLAIAKQHWAEFIEAIASRKADKNRTVGDVTFEELCETSEAEVRAIRIQVGFTDEEVRLLAAWDSVLAIANWHDLECIKALVSRLPPDDDKTTIGEVLTEEELGAIVEQVGFTDEDREILKLDRLLHQ